MKARVAWYAALQWSMSEEARPLAAIVLAIDRFAFWLAAILGIGGLAVYRPPSCSRRFRVRDIAGRLRRALLLCACAAALAHRDGDQRRRADGAAARNGIARGGRGPDRLDGGRDRLRRCRDCPDPRRQRAGPASIEALLNRAEPSARRAQDMRAALRRPSSSHDHLSLVAAPDPPGVAVLADRHGPTAAIGQVHLAFTVGRRVDTRAAPRTR